MAILTSSQEFLSDLQITKYFNVAFLGIWVLDYCVTFEDEVRWVWGRKWDYTRLIFIFSRYLPFFAVIVTICVAMQNPNGNCKTYNSVWEADFPPIAKAACALAIISTEALLALRTYAFWNRSKKLLVCLLVCAALFIAVAFVLSTKIHDSQSSCE
ncbi:hypothetical protein SERLA73DRAFT_158589 [Serpula lacrymans var. lacrymans S7.3]|uniref:DUF6533 domain-containing protein n=2 Tax=Serpula lacrymans var. lacrymans TaxID=341189 RepID=F8PML4_SERL3|nr:uncharacterized protein SERLADRAFT_413401 [Serpula lacrymans var. lacrymans S7.9]EGO02846.1 hypothetical protein SERLA73DRAFT_158589 [Serpula lacrymans var. lacrymans S7.3]EGO28542.1 hypothetical protein SERLADRAFT_413401 [Serpula lacrymans var. lacrymans S7.9]